MAGEDAIQRKHERLTAATNDYFWHTCLELTARWRQAMLTLPPSVLREIKHLEVITSAANQQLNAAAHPGAVGGGEPVEGSPRDRALASMERLSETADTMTRLLDELLRT